MSEFLSRRRRFLNIIMDREAPSQPFFCAGCDGIGATWRCIDCLSQPLFCTICCKSAHKASPFHRIEQWMETFFVPSWLTSAGLSVYLGHGGDQCPTSTYIHDSDNGGAGGEEWMDDEPDQPPPSFDLGNGMFLPPRPGAADINGCTILVAVTSIGVHHIGIGYCSCPGAASQEEQLLIHGLYPATFVRPRTVFTFGVLDDFLMDNLECKTTAMKYFSKLRRKTCPSFPHLVPVCRTIPCSIP